MKPELAKDKWSIFQRAQIEKDREAFDDMASKARLHAVAIASATFPVSVELMLLPVLLENEK